MKWLGRFLLSVTLAWCVMSSVGVAQSRLMGDLFTYSMTNSDGNLGETEDPVTREFIEHALPPAILTFDGIEEVAGSMKVNERAVPWAGEPGGIPVVQAAGIEVGGEVVEEVELLDWEFAGEVVEFSFKTVDGGWFADDITGQSAITIRELDWANSDPGAMPYFFEQGFYIYFSEDGVPVTGYATDIYDIGLFVRAHPFDESVPEVFYIGYSRGQVEEVTAPFEGSVDLTFGTSQLDENDGSWAALATAMSVANVIGSANGLHLGFLVEPPAGQPIMIPGDYNHDGVVDTADIDLQANAMLDPMPDLATFDENADGLVNSADRVIWVEDHAKTWFGDANFDGVFSTDDLVAVFAAGKYETQQAAIWAEGDWTGDKVFDSGDLVAAFSDGGFELGPRPPAVAAVPEPASLVLVVLARS